MSKRYPWREQARDETVRLTILLQQLVVVLSAPTTESSDG